MKDSNQTMAKRPLQSRWRGGPINMGTARTTVTIPLTIPQCCTHQPGVKCVQANTCPCQAANRPCKSSLPSENCRNRGPTWASTAPRLTPNMSETIEESQEAAPIICQAIEPVVFHQDTPAFSLSVLSRETYWPALPMRADTAHTTTVITEAASPNAAVTAAVRISNIN